MKEQSIVEQEIQEIRKKEAEIKRHLKEKAMKLKDITLDEMSCKELIISLKVDEDYEKFTEMRRAMVLYAIHKDKKYKEYGFESVTKLAEALGFGRRAAFEWIKYVEDYGENFPILIQKVGLNLRFFRDMKTLPEPVQKSIVEGEKVIINDKEHDLSNMGKDAESREVIRSLVHEVNKSLGKYDTITRYKKHNEKLEKKIKELNSKLEEAMAPLPRETKFALEVMEKYKERAKLVFHFFNNVNPAEYDEIIRLELLNAVFYLCDVFTLLAHKISNLYDVTRPYPAHILESEIKAFGQKYKCDDDLGIGISDTDDKEDELDKENARLKAALEREEEIALEMGNEKVRQEHPAFYEKHKRHFDGKGPKGTV